MTNLCPICNQESLLQYDNITYCNNLYCPNVYKQFIRCFLEQLRHFFDEVILDRLLVFNNIGYWTHPIHVLNLYHLPLENNNTLFNNIIEGLEPQEKERFISNLVWLPGYIDSHIISTPFYPTLENQEEDLQEYIWQTTNASEFFNILTGFSNKKFKTDSKNLMVNDFYKEYFTSVSIKKYIELLIEWHKAFSK
jgi:hypothetical protein